MVVNRRTLLAGAATLGFGTARAAAPIATGGELAFVKQGPYESEDELAADVQRYALGSTAADG